MFCNRNNAVAPSGAGVPSIHRVAVSDHRDPICESTPIRARTSSPRLVSCVDSDVIARGQYRARSALAR